MGRTAILLVALLAVAGCGSSSKSVFTPTTEIGQAVTTTTDKAAAAHECRATADAARAASAVSYANSPGTYPATFTEMTTGKTPPLVAQAGVVVTATTLTGTGWTLTMTGGGAKPPTFTCS
jgi:hypothetical protein